MKTTNEYPKIEGIVLNDAVVKRLHEYQEKKGECLNMDLEAIAEAVCFIVELIDVIPAHYKEEAVTISTMLSYVRRNLKDLADSESKLQ